MKNVEKDQEEYRQLIEEKNNSILEILKGVDFNQIEYIIDSVTRQVSYNRNSLIFSGQHSS